MKSNVKMNMWSKCEKCENEHSVSKLKEIRPHKMWKKQMVILYLAKNENN